MKSNELIIIIAAGAGLYFLTRKTGAMAGAGGALAYQPMPTAANLSGGTSRSDGTAAVRGDYSIGTGDRFGGGSNGGYTCMGPGCGTPIDRIGYPVSESPSVFMPGTAPAAKVMGPSDVERFFDGLTTRGFGDVFGGEIRHPLLDGKTPCQAIDAMNSYAAARHPDHPEWRWTTNDIPSPFNLWVC